MGFFNLIRRLFGGGSSSAEKYGAGRGVDELARRIGLGADELRNVRPTYRRFTIPKRAGGKRTILAPDDRLKAVQRTILRRLLRRLSCHPAAVGFERDHSIVSNALCHVAQAVVVRMDIKDFFQSTPADRVERYFRRIGWNADAARLLVRLCTYDGGLPPGAPTSPRLSNLVNYNLDARLAGLAETCHAVYTRYADDMTFSFETDDAAAIHCVIGMTKYIVGQEGYTLHQGRKLRIYREHNRQVVTGLVVNERVNLPRRTRRWLRSVAHHLATGRPATVTAAQLDGWRALHHMIATQRGDGQADS